MRTTLTTLGLLALLGTVPALAQTTVTGTPADKDAASSAKSNGQDAVTRPNTDKATNSNPAGMSAPSNVKLEEGANSFTEGQTRGRLEEAGFKDVKDLKKDDKGIWHGKAMMNGKAVSVGIDFKGNVATQ